MERISNCVVYKKFEDVPNFVTGITYPNGTLLFAIAPNELDHERMDWQARKNKQIPDDRPDGGFILYYPSLDFDRYSGTFGGSYTDSELAEFRTAIIKTAPESTNE